MRDVVRPGVTQIDNDRLIDTFDVYEISVVIAFPKHDARKKNGSEQHDAAKIFSEHHAPLNRPRLLALD